MPSFFITGTDTGVGKTTFACWLVRAWRESGHDAVALKPICTGGREDADLLRDAMGSHLEIDEINPVHFREPAAPLVAARAENRSIDFQALNRGIESAAARFSHLAVEGIGGWRVPLAPDYDVRDWARELGFPVVVVARGTLGTLNHTLLTVDSVREAGLICAGVVVNSGAPEATAPPDRVSPDFDFACRRNILLLRDLLGLPILEFHRGVQAAGHVPLWLGGKEI
jgi:dethiobiotin synthetase